MRAAMALPALLLALALCGAAQGAAPPQRWKLAAPDASRDLLLAAPQGLARLAAYDQVRARARVARACRVAARRERPLLLRRNPNRRECGARHHAVAVR